MSKTCGCTANTCGCCEGTQILTPVAIENRPGLPAVSFRAGTHAAFFETMKARLSAMTVDILGTDGITTTTYRPLTALTTRDPSDFAIALLDGWATVGDVLTFYQERIANEGYLRTALELRSVLELARLIGYRVRPGVAATVYLAYTLDNNQAAPVLIPAGSRSQSVPLQSTTELPQFFETSDDLTAETAWNNLQPRMTRPQNITFDTALAINTIYVDSSTTGLKTGDHLLLVFDPSGNPSVVRSIASVSGQFTDQRLVVQLQPVSASLIAATPILAQAVAAGEASGFPSDSGSALQLAQERLSDVNMGLPSNPTEWIASIGTEVKRTQDTTLTTWFNTFEAALNAALGTTNPPLPTPTNPSLFVNNLLTPLIVQPRDTFALNRNLSAAFTPGSDVQPRLLIDFAPQLKQTFYHAWANAVVNTAPGPPQGVYVMRAAAALFGASSPPAATYDSSKTVNPQLTPWTVAQDEQTNALFLEQPNESILASGYVIIQTPAGDGTMERQVGNVTSVQTTQRTAYGVSAKTTLVTLAANWWEGTQDEFSTLQGAYVYTQSELLNLVGAPVTDPVGGIQIELDDLYQDLVSGRWVIFSGERADIPGVAGVNAAELAMISGVTQGFDATLPGDTTHTTLTLATSTTYQYKRDITLTIFGNVVKATHGQTINEPLGSGDGSQSLQSFTLKQPPVTYIAASTAAGAASTLQVYVNNIEWQETDTLAGLGPKDHDFITETDENASTTLIFGTGQEGSRLPTGVQNVAAIYRSGIGQPGNVLAGQISMLQTKPLGVTAVINPLDASGGADMESVNQARDNTPIAVMALDRLVSVQDYADFARSFAGIGKADAERLSNGHRQLVYLTIAGAGDIPIDPSSDLYQNLVEALEDLGDHGLAIQVDFRELLTLVLSAKVNIDPTYLWNPVAAQIRAMLLDTFGFEKRGLGQPALLCEVISAIQNIPGVVYVDIDAFGGIPEKTLDPATGVATLLTLDQISQVVQTLIKGTGGNLLLNSRSTEPSQAVIANLGRLQSGVLRPAQLAIFTPDVPDTIVLNQIL